MNFWFIWLASLHSKLKLSSKWMNCTRDLSFKTLVNIHQAMNLGFVIHFYGFPPVQSIGHGCLVFLLLWLGHGDILIFNLSLIVCGLVIHALYFNHILHLFWAPIGFLSAKGFWICCFLLCNCWLNIHGVFYAHFGSYWTNLVLCTFLAFGVGLMCIRLRSTSILVSRILFFWINYIEFHKFNIIILNSF